MIRRSFLVIATLAGMAATSASALGPLKDVAHVREGIITAGMALKIDEECSSVSVRLIRGMNFLEGLKSHAEGLGYTDAQIDAYLDDKAEENRLRAIAASRLASLGVVDGDAASYCSVGRAQIAEGTQLGRLLR